MLKKKLSLFSLFLAFILLLTSCGSRLPFDPRQYNTSTSKQEEAVPEPEDGLDLDVDNTLFDEYSDKNMNGFSADVFDTWVIRGWFDSNEVPTFVYDSVSNPESWQAQKASWSLNDASRSEYKASGPDTKAKGYDVSSLVYYMSKGVHPMYAVNGGYNTGAHGERIKRFAFYKFTGTAFVSLSNYMIAVDTYTKLVFAFAQPTAFTSIIGNKNPSAWGSIDGNNGAMYKFYEYDPAGIVRSDGTVELYDWYTTGMGNSVYAPSPPADPTGRDVATYGKAGRSPYYAAVASDNENVFWNNIKGQTYNYRGSRGSSDTLYKYVVSADGKTITEYTQEWKETTETSTGVVYTYDSYEGEGVATYSGITVTLGSEAIIIDGKEATVSDTGPYIKDRLKGRTFVSADEKTTYIFNSSGSSVSINGSSKDIAETEDARITGAYKNGIKSFVIAYYYGFRLYSENGDIDNVLKFTSDEHRWTIFDDDPPTDEASASFNPAYLEE